jgi:hypothetical protein
VRPAARRIESSKKTVVVFPFVPVTPRTVRPAVGYPKKCAAMRGIARRVSATTI